jgi:hypothetical protein
MEKKESVPMVHFPMNPAVPPNPEDVLLTLL